MQKFIKYTIKNTPGLYYLAQAYLDRIDRNVLEDLSKTPHCEAGRVLEVLRRLNSELPRVDQEWVSKIEAERDRLLGRQDLLVDGSLGKGEISDDGVTVKRACEASKALKPALLLYFLIQKYTPKNVLELGTNLGISSAYIAAALKTNDQGGVVTTLDASPYRQRLAKEVHRNLGLDNVVCVAGLFTETLDSTLNDIGPVDFAFIDGHHQYKPTINYFNTIWEFSVEGTMFIFDDIRWSDGMKRAWSEIKTDKRLGLMVDLHTVAICAGAEKGDAGRYILPPMRVLRDRK